MHISAEKVCKCCCVLFTFFSLSQSSFFFFGSRYGIRNHRKRVQHSFYSHLSFVFFCAYKHWHNLHKTRDCDFISNQNSTGKNTRRKRMDTWCCCILLKTVVVDDDDDDADFVVKYDLFMAFEMWSAIETFLTFVQCRKYNIEKIYYFGLWFNTCCAQKSFVQITLLTLFDLLLLRLIVTIR